MKTQNAIVSPASFQSRVFKKLYKVGSYKLVCHYMSKDVDLLVLNDNFHHFRKMSL